MPLLEGIQWAGGRRSVAWGRNFRVTHMTIEAMTADRKTISINKASELVGVSRRTIYNWIASGKVEYRRTAGGSVRIFVDTLWRTPSTGPTPSASRRVA